MESYNRLRQLVDDLADDFDKTAGGNKAAGTRARKTLQEIRNLAQEMRKEILERRKESDPGGSAAGSGHTYPV